MILTAREKKVSLFVLAALLLGITVKVYRERHPPPPAQVQAQVSAKADR
jgi:hypothetical protein